MLTRFFDSKYKGVYVDVGAGFPIWYSNSVEFRKNGWHIISFEPQPQMCEEFRNHGYQVHQFACTDSDIGKTEFAWNPAVAGGMGGSALEWRGDDVGSDNIIIEVEAYTLNTLMSRFHPEIDRIDILDIDVEGWQFEVLKGFDIDRYSPRIVIVENILKNVKKTRQYLSTHGYKLVERLENGNLEIYTKGRIARLAVNA